MSEPLWRRYLRFVRADPARDVDDELAFHLDRLTDEELARGTPPAQARARARERFGDLDASRRDTLAIERRQARRAGRTERMAGLAQDLRYAARALRRTPGFTVVAMLTLAIGIGANSAIFSVVNGVLLRPMPYHEAERLVVAWEHNLVRGNLRNVANPGNVLDWQSRSRTLEALAFHTFTGITLIEGDGAERLMGRAVSWNVFDVLGVRPAVGRAFGAADADSGSPRRLVLSHGLWLRRFGGDTSVVGRSLAIPGGAVEVIGVMPPGLRVLENEEYWEVLRISPAMAQRRGRWLFTVGRLAPGATVAQADAELKTIAATLVQEYPDFNTGWSARVVGLQDDVVGPARTKLWVALGAVALVLLIACANVGNLLLARAQARGHELSLRSALGASRARVARLWLLECAQLVAGGLLAGLALALAMLAGLRALDPPDLPRLAEVRLDWRVLGLTGGAAAVVALGLALLSSVGISAVEQGLVRADRRVTTGRGARRFRAVLVVTQVALALVLLTGAGLLGRTLQRLSGVDPGFDARGLWTGDLVVPGVLYGSAARVSGFYEDLQTRLRGLPGIEAAGVTTWVPFGGGGSATGFHPLDRPPPEPGQSPVSDIRIVSTGYFEVMRIPLRAGRLFTTADDSAAPRVAVVSETFARQTWPDADPLGRQVRVSWSDADTAVTIVGVVGDIRITGLDVAVRPMLYFAHGQNPSGNVSLLVRSRDPASVTAPVRAVLREMDVAVPLRNPTTMAERIGDALAGRRTPAVLLGLFAAIALGLAALGLYGVLAYSVGLRQRELGVRLALGARPAEVLWLVVRGGLALALAGVVAGGLAALGATRVLRTLLFETTPTDPATFAAVTAVLLVTAVVACLLPARRAARLDPVEALRADG